MSDQKKLYKYKDLTKVATRLRDDLNNHHFVLLYAYNGTGKTRLSMEFKDISKKRKKNPVTDTLYYNAYTEDLFHWNNDLENDSERHLIINKSSRFFEGFRELALEEKIFNFLERYTDFNFTINYDDWTIVFRKQIKNPKFRPEAEEPEYIILDNIKVSRGEENIFIWCIFLAICELAIDGDESYSWVRHIYIDDPISSLDDNNAIAVASDLAQLLKRGKEKVRVVISTHHSLFFNVMYNELRSTGHKSHFLHKNGADGYVLRATDDTPFFHHVALLTELKKVSDSAKINTYHFNMLRSVLEKTSTFFGYDDFSKCIYGVDDEVLFSRALNLLSHGKYSIYQPTEMNEDNKDLFKRILNAFLDTHNFQLPEIFA
ncbi:AAA family ATPase [Spirosoma sp. KCTC 42546]|uniref:AAA family ATPase n=1 Tax=Spirosoma sp. KCTC 42546 TaxID=2520506 RepID=UPI001158154F|nr:AAA family ATPase [Spirosoma sp. KCTC 42546]QDK80113.1 AAA family ATPase [Spirosoma sp. KCTC 42546]